MEDLLQEQQKVLERALDLHAAMVRRFDRFEKRLASISTSPPSRNAEQSFEWQFSAVSRRWVRSDSAQQVTSSTGSDFPQRVATSAVMSNPQLNHANKGTVQLQQLRQPLLNGESNELSASAVPLVPADTLSSQRQSADELTRTQSHKMSDVVKSITGVIQVERALEQDAVEDDFVVEDMYNDSRCARIAKSSHFHIVTFSVIVVSALYIALETDHIKSENPLEAPLFFQITSNLICAYFVFELLVRFGAFRESRSVLQDHWFLFDLILVLSLVWEVWIMLFLYVVWSGAVGGNKVIRCLTVLRILRVFRLVRAVRFFPELMILVTGMLAAMRSVLSIVLLLAVTIYLFAILFTQLFMNTDFSPGYFDSVLQSMQFLLVQVLCGADPDFMTLMHNHGAMHYFLWLAFLFLCQLTIMNMLIGIVCNAIDDSTEELEEAAFGKDITKQVNELIQAMDEDQSGSMSKDEFDNFMCNQDIRKTLYNVGVNLDGVQEFFGGIYRAVDELSMDDVLSMILQFRDTKRTTVKDLMVLRRMNHMDMAAFEDRLMNSTGNDTNTV